MASTQYTVHPGLADGTMVPLPSMPMEGNENSINLCVHPSERTALEHMLFFPSTFPFDAKHKVVQASNIILSFLLGKPIPDGMVFGTASTMLVTSLALSWNLSANYTEYAM